jgi:hypothetical protein
MTDIRHTTRPLHVAGLEGTQIRLVPEPTRLVVLVHGFRGEPLGSWGEFGRGTGSEWWLQSDLLFVGYASERLDPTGVANALRIFIERLFPQLPEEYLLAGEAYYLRDPERYIYAELVLVGHSLGGLIVRRAAVDIVRSWERARIRERPSILSSGRMCLFSPATAGFEPTSSPGVLRSLLGDRLCAIILRNPPALRDLRCGSEVLSGCRRLTERAANDYKEMRLLHPEIIWANPDNIVIASDYDTDPPAHSQTGVNHRSVCKPHAGYTLPWEVVETGELP